MMGSVLDRRARTFRVAPAGAVDRPPPVARRSRTPRPESIRQEPGKDRRPAEPLGLGNVPRFGDEGGKPFNGHGAGFQPERLQPNCPARAFAILWQFGPFGPDKAVTACERCKGVHSGGLFQDRSPNGMAGPYRTERSRFPLTYNRCRDGASLFSEGTHAGSRLRSSAFQ